MLIAQINFNGGSRKIQNLWFLELVLDHQQLRASPPVLGGSHPLFDTLAKNLPHPTCSYSPIPTHKPEM
jgi:hypothetical protein